jgi:predicted ATP-grasp superfamily ATP-dependent carboligase
MHGVATSSGTPAGIAGLAAMGDRMTTSGANAKPDGRLPAIVVGRGETGLGALRALVLAGIPAYVACPKDDLVTRSRWYWPVPGAGWDGSINAATAELLRAMPLEGAVLVPGCDDAALWLADLPHGDLGHRFRVSSSPRASLEILQDKSLFGRYLASTAIPHPRTFMISSAADVAAVPFDSLDRVFVKPADSQAFNAAFGAKGMWANSRAEFEAIGHRLDGRGFNLIAQEYDPGTCADHYFIDGFRDANGALTGLFARRRWRIYPADFGNSSYCESVPLQQLGAAVGHLETLLADLQYRGIFSAEFKRDARDGRLCILEVNTRAWWYVEFAARCGVNVCAMAYQDAQGLSVTRPRHAPVDGAGCVRLDDFKAMRSSGENRSWWRAAWQWACAHHHVFRWDDPRPAGSLLWAGLRRRMTQTPRPMVADKSAVLAREKRTS